MTDKKKTARLRWKMQPKATGLAAIVQGPRSSWLTDGDLNYACVSSLRHSREQWYWVAGWDSKVPHKNTCNEPQSFEDAKAAALAYVKEHLKAQS